MQISIIIVNYKSLFYLKKCLNSINTEQKNIKEIIIVNNDKNTLNLKKGKKIRVIENGKNLGFASASNIGASKAQGDFLFFLNPDTEIQNKNFNLLIKEFQKNPIIGIIGVKIINSNTSLAQGWSCGKKTNLWRIFSKKFTGKPWSSQKSIFVDWVSGGALLIRKTDFEKIGEFDNNFFMYFEDQDLCLRLKKINKKCLFFPFFEILHHDGKSWKNKLTKKKKIYHQSQEYFFKKHSSFFEFLAFKLFKKILKK